MHSNVDTVFNKTQTHVAFEHNHLQPAASVATSFSQQCLTTQSALLVNNAQHSVEVYEAAVERSPFFLN